RNSTLLRLNKNTVPFASFTLFTGNTINQVGRHYITVKVWDNNCPVRGTASVTFVVNVRKARTNTVLTQVKNCGVLDVSSTTLNTNIFWEVYDSRFTVIKQQLSRKISTQLPSGGKYYIKSYLPAQNGFCELNQLDSVVVPNFTKPEINMGADRTVCNGVELELSPRLFNTYKEYELFVNGELKSFPYKIQVNEAKSLMFRVIQKDGCFAEDNIQINVFPRLAYKVYDDTFCVNATFPASLGQIQVDRNRIFAVNMTTKDNQIALSPLNAIDWQLDVMAPSKGQHQVNVLIQDRNYCNYKDSFKVHIVEPEPINFNLPVAVCVNTEPIELPVRNNGFWTCLNKAGLVQNNILTIDKTDKSDIQLLYTEKVQCLNTRTYTIRVMDTSEITFGHDQKLKICQSQSPFALRAFPGGGNWYGNYMLPGGTFDAYSAAGKTTELTYRYSNLNDCISSAGVSIEVEKLPELNIEKSKDRICVGDILNLVAASNVLAPGYWQTDGGGSFDNLNNAQVSYTPVPGDVNKPYLTFTYTMQTSGVCGLVPSETIVVVKSGQIGEILKDYPTELCEPAVFNFKSTYQKLEKQYWMVNDSIYEEFDYNFNFNVTLPAGDYVVKTLVNDSTCQAMAMSQNITVWPKPNVQLISNPGSRMSREYPRLYLKDLSYCKYGHQSNWYINNNWIGDSRELNYKVEETRDTFTIKLVAVSNKGGCADSSSQMFVFIPINQLYIPNAFSPDSKGPNENNVFKVVGPPMKYFKIEIFNRYGEKVYMSNDMNATWDGTYKNQLCIQGDYFYKIETTDTEGVSRDYSGTVTVIR
ncbi:MAG: gliding motility-associated C-terminal domain-containing protein, partial [Bacteroidetes bacterium]|nr:gliding motility-associated C-terminal domain-containing protein [Bacteroidota bacterium]